MCRQKPNSGNSDLEWTSCAEIRLRSDGGSSMHYCTINPNEKWMERDDCHSDSFTTIDFLPLKREAPVSQCVRYVFETNSQFTNLTPPTIEDMWFETPNMLIDYR
jgi:hypothetical protein